MKPQEFLNRGGTLAAAALLALTLSACSGGEDQENEAARSPSPSQSTTTPDDTANDDTANEALLEAGRTGLDQVPDSTVYSIERESDGWEVEVVTSDGTKHEMTISDDGRDVVKEPREDGSDAKYSDRVQATQLDYEQAVKAILDEVPGAQVKELNLDEERGIVIWEADVVDDSGAERSLEIDAASGEVLENKLDD